MSILSLTIGETTLLITQRLPSTAFTSNPIVSRQILRSADGTGHIQNQYEIYEITVSGLAQDTVPQLRYEYQRQETIELTSLVDRIERISASGLTSLFDLTRQARTDVALIVEFPIGTAVTPSLVSFVNVGGEFARVDVGFNPPAGTNSVLFNYYPIHVGTIESLTSDYNPIEDEEVWTCLFKEV